MLRRRKEKICTWLVNNLQGELWEKEFSVVFHLTTVVHKFDSRLVIN